jgi:hypothetical protein
MRSSLLPLPGPVSWVQTVIPPAPSVSPLSMTVFVAVVVAVVLAAVGAWALASDAPRRAALRAGAVAILWVGTWSALALADVWRQPTPEGFPPRIILLFGGANLGAIALALSPWGKRLALRTTFAGLVAFHAFRLPLEWVLHAWGEQGAIPMAMTWEGRNLDVVTGVLALSLGLWSLRAPLSRVALWGFQLVGLGLLINVGITALTSVPGPFYVPGRVPPLLIGFDFPTTLIAPVCVAGALAAHLILFRALAAAHRGERPWPGARGR